MTIEKLDDCRILISLCKDDMEHLDLNENTMTLKNQEFKETIRAILAMALTDSNTDMKGKKACIEAMPYDDGCFLLITLIKKQRRNKKYTVRKKKRCIFKFDDFEDLINLSKIISNRNIEIGANSLFESEGRFYLYMGDCSQDIQKLFCEYASRVPATQTDIARFNEYGSLIIAGNALMQINGAFI